MDSCFSVTVLPFLSTWRTSPLNKRAFSIGLASGSRVPPCPPVVPWLCCARAEAENPRVSRIASRDFNFTVVSSSRRFRKPSNAAKSRYPKTWPALRQPSVRTISMASIRMRLRTCSSRLLQSCAPRQGRCRPDCGWRCTSCQTGCAPCRTHSTAYPPCSVR